MYKQVFFTELIPSQYFNSIINYISTKNEYLWYYYIIYDSKHSKSNSFNILFHDNILQKHIPQISCASIDISDKTDTEIETMLKRFYYLFGVVVVIVDSSKLNIVLKSLCEEYTSFDPSTLVPIVFPIDSFTFATLYSSPYKDHVYFATNYKLDSLENLKSVLNRYSLNVTENLFVLPPLYIAHEIIFEVIYNIKDSGIHNRDFFYKYIHSNMLHTFSKEVQIKSNNMLKTTIDLNYYNIENEEEENEENNSSNNNNNIELGYSF